MANALNRHEGLPQRFTPAIIRRDALGRPRRIRVVVAEIQARHGESPPGYVGGIEFHNRERKLPPGRYREYDVHARVRGKDRGPERLVVEQETGLAYYTPDHYRTFTRIDRTVTPLRK